MYLRLSNNNWANPNSAKCINIIVAFIKLLALFRVKWIKTQSGRTDEFLHSFNFLEICYIILIFFNKWIPARKSGQKNLDN